MLIVTVRGMLSVQRRLVASAVKRAKNDRLFKKARSVEAGMLSNGSTGCTWRWLKDIQRERVSLKAISVQTY